MGALGALEGSGEMRKRMPCRGVEGRGRRNLSKSRSGARWPTTSKRRGSTDPMPQPTPNSPHCSSRWGGGQRRPWRTFAKSPSSAPPARGRSSPSATRCGLARNDPAPSRHTPSIALRPPSRPPRWRVLESHRSARRRESRRLRLLCLPLFLRPRRRPTPRRLPGGQRGEGREGRLGCPRWRCGENGAPRPPPPFVPPCTPSIARRCYV